MYLTKEHLHLLLQSAPLAFSSVLNTAPASALQIFLKTFSNWRTCASVALPQYSLCIWYAGLGCDPLNSSHDRAVWKRWDTSSAEGLMMKDSPGLWESHERQWWASWRSVLRSHCIQSNRHSFSVCLREDISGLAFRLCACVCLCVCMCVRVGGCVGGLVQSAAVNFHWTSRSGEKNSWHSHESVL